jgi:tetratricopeptide (TPR) repeat protein
VGRDAVRSRVGLLALAALLPAGCAAVGNLKKNTYQAARSFLTDSYDDPDFEAKMAAGDRLFEAADYPTARRVYADLAGNTTNPVLVAEKARFMEAECFRAERKYPEAVDTYHKMLVDFPAGAYRERACQEIFAIADYWLDDTRDEIRASDAGENVFARKVARLFTVDRTKPPLDQEGRALQALEHVTMSDATGPTADKALFWAGYVNFYRGRFEEADHFFSLLVEMHKDSPLRPTATELAIVCKNNSTGGSAYDGQKAAEALQLVHHAEASMPELRSPEKAEAMTRHKLAIRMQQAEKDFKVAEYWEQTNHPGSAYFSYEIVRRRYPGTKFADVAATRMEALRGRAAQDAVNPPGPGLVTGLRRRLDQLTGRPPVPVGDPDVPTTAGRVPPPPAEIVQVGGRQ